MFQTNGIGNATGDKLLVIKCKLDTEAGVNVMPVSTYQYVNTLEFDEQGKPDGGYGKNRTILKGTMVNLPESMT